MNSREMILIFSCLLLCYNIRAEDQLRRIGREIDGTRYCDFDEARKNYNATDLLQCIDELAFDLVDRESDWPKSRKDQKNWSTGRQISFMDVFSNIFNNAGTSHQSSSLPAGPTSVYQQSNYPAGTAALSPGFQLNLLEALSTVSRHDDYKCVPRILCEMASGKLPGRSLGKQGSGFFEFLGRNVFTEYVSCHKIDRVVVSRWLTKIDVAGTSPLLNFGRAMILGYSNRGNSRACFEAFPKCPRGMNGLIYYLNNYNGGFFRLFNKFQGGKYREHGGIPAQRVGDRSKIEVRERIVAGNLKEYAETEPIWKKIRLPVVKEYYDKREFPRYDEVRNGNEIIFPDRKELNNEPATNGLQNDTPEIQSNIWQSENVAFFPQERGDRKFSRFRFPSSYTVT